MLIETSLDKEPVAKEPVYWNIPHEIPIVPMWAKIIFYNYFFVPIIRYSRQLCMPYIHLCYVIHLVVEGFLYCKERDICPVLNGQHENRWSFGINWKRLDQPSHVMLAYSYIKVFRYLGYIGSYSVFQNDVTAIMQYQGRFPYFISVQEVFNSRVNYRALEL